MSDSRAVSVTFRSKFSERDAYEFVQAGDWHQDFFRRVDHRWLGNLKLINLSANASMDRQVPVLIDSDLLFNQAYSSKVGAPLTFYSVMRERSGVCFYVREIQKLRCSSRE